MAVADAYRHEMQEAGRRLERGRICRQARAEDWPRRRRGRRWRHSAEWAEETHLAARAVWEQLPGSRVVDDAYYAQILPTFDRQLGLAAHQHEHHEHGGEHSERGTEEGGAAGSHAGQGTGCPRPGDKTAEPPLDRSGEGSVGQDARESLPGPLRRLGSGGPGPPTRWARPRPAPWAGAGSPRPL